LAAIVYDSLLLAGVLFVGHAPWRSAIAVAAWGGESVTLNHPMQGHPFFSMLFVAGLLSLLRRVLGPSAARLWGCVPGGLRVQRRDGNVASAGGRR
jgi:hypothetical protein